MLLYSSWLIVHGNKQTGLLKGNMRNILIRNSSIGFISQIVTIIFTFVTRNLFIKFIGIELLGINNTFSSILSTLSLSELGVQSAIIFSLYKPLKDEDTESINAYLNILRILYLGVGIIFMGFSIIILPFLNLILKGIEVGLDIYIYFLLQAGTSTCTYFYAYKRALLYADQKDYVSNSIDMACSIMFNILQCFALMVFRSYLIYLVMRILQVYLANFIVNIFCERYYPYLHKEKIDKEKLKKVFGDVKNIIAGKIAAYIYLSTDNIVISTFVSTVSVGYLTNYTIITNNIRKLVSSILSPIIPAIGNYLVKDASGNSREKLFLLYSHVRYLMAYFIIIPMLVLIDDFIIMWIGNDMLMNHMIIVLLSMDLYIDFVHSSTYDFITSAGLFKDDKYIEVIGASTNIVSSVVLVQFVGIAGVLIGTVISQIIFWIGRSIILYVKCLRVKKRRYFLYWIKNVLYLLIFGVGYIFAVIISKKIVIDNYLLDFLISGIFMEIILFLISLIVLLPYEEHREILRIILKKMKGC